MEVEQKLDELDRDYENAIDTIPYTISLSGREIKTMTDSKPRKRKGLATHYSYLGGGDVMRKVQKLFNLEGVTPHRRRILIDNLITRDGEVLAKLPENFQVDCDLDVLEKYLKAGLK